MKKIFVTANLPGASLETLRRNYRVEIFPEERPPSREELIAGARQSHALITMVTDRVDAAVMGASANLKIISNCGVGFENIDVAYATRKGIFVTNTPGVLTEATADLAWGLILSTGRRIPEADSFLRRGEFIGWLPTLLLGVNIHGKTLGVYGMGRIGGAIAKRASGFDMRVIYHNRSRHSGDESRAIATWVDFPTLLRESDFLVIASPLNPQSRGRFGFAEFEQMKRTAVIVNVGRGQIIKEGELVRALREGVIWGAGLDVYETEPEVGAELLALPNSVLLPHIGSASLETRVRMSDMAAAAVASALGGDSPANLVNADALREINQSAR
ncbi:MAG: 2-hydroxyacid dehydrogenase [Deltaproteobacteria bacterium]